MQTLKNIILISYLFVSSLAHAAPASMSQKVFSVVVLKKYTKQYTGIYKEGSEYFCKTELNPKIFITYSNKEKAIASYVEALKSVTQENNKKCNDFSDEMLFTLGKENYEICSNNIIAKKVLVLLADDCGRNF